MKRLFLFVLLAAAVSGSVFAQDPQRLQRTPEEEATQQTQRLVRELGIRDSVRIDTIYRMHLKYANIRQHGLSRKENMERMQAIYAELKLLLTPEEFDRFMNHPAELPRRPRGANFVAPNELQRKQAPPAEPR